MQRSSLPLSLFSLVSCSIGVATLTLAIGGCDPGGGGSEPDEDNTLTTTSGAEDPDKSTTSTTETGADKDPGTGTDDDDSATDDDDPSTDDDDSATDDDDDSTTSGGGDSTTDDDDSTTSGGGDDSSTTPDKAPIPCEGKSPKVLLKTSFGDITVQLDGENTPITVKNFTRYVDEKFYDQTLFHRIIDDFVIQGGGYDINGKLKPTHDPIKLEIDPNRKHKDGTISMARTDVKDSATSQFFICDGDEKCGRLDGNYAAFGETIDGLDVVHKIASVPTGGGNEGKPNEKVVIESAYCIK